MAFKKFSKKLTNWPLTAVLIIVFLYFYVANLYWNVLKHISMTNREMFQRFPQIQSKIFETFLYSANLWNLFLLNITIDLLQRNARKELRSNSTVAFVRKRIKDFLSKIYKRKIFQGASGSSTWCSLKWISNYSGFMQVDCVDYQINKK